MGFVAVFDKQLFYNPTNRYTILQMKTADIMVPQEARRPYKSSDHLIRFTAVGFDLPRNDSVEVELEGTWVKDAKCGLRWSGGKRSCPPQSRASGLTSPLEC